MNKLYFLIIIFLVVFSSCEKTIEFTGNLGEPVTIVNGLLTPDSLFCIEISTTKNIEQTGAIPSVENAIVDVFEGEKLIETLKHQSKGIYKGLLKPEFGKKYELKVTRTKSIVSSKTEIPSPVAINKLESEIINITEAQSNYLEITIDFTDPSEINNFYRISVEGDSKNAITYPEVSSTDIIMKAVFGNENNIEITNNNDFLIFNDKLINRKNYKLRIQVYDNDAISRLLGLKDDIACSYKVRLHSISEEYYLYLKSKELNQLTFNNPFSEPVPIFSNIKNGGGILGAYSISEKNVDVLYSKNLITH